MDATTLLDWACKILLGIVGWHSVRLMNAMEKSKTDMTDHKLHVSENYAKKSELSPIYKTLSDIQGDIKELLGRKREQDK